MNAIKSSQWFYWGIIAMITIAHVFVYFFMPFTCDDYWYMTPLRDYCLGIDPSFPTDNLWSCWSYHYHNDNIRLANIVFTFFLLIPKIIPSIISGLLVGVMLMLSAKVSGINGRNSLLMAMLALMLSFLLPWYEQMFSLCYAFNYIWASALALLLAYIFYCKKTLPGLVWSFFLGIIVGAWHEGFSVPLLSGVVIYTILCRQACNRRSVAIMVGLVVGILWLANAPGLNIRVQHIIGELDYSILVRRLMLYHIPLVMLLISVFVASFSRNTRKFLLDPLFISFVTICLVGVILNIVIDIGVRTGWMGYLFGIIATIYLWKNMSTVKCAHIKPFVKRILAIAVSLFLLLHYIVVAYYAVKIKTEFEYVLEEYQESSDGVVFADVTYDYQVLPLAWKKTYFENFTYTWIAYWIDNYYNSGKNLRVIPACLYNAENLNAVKVKGNNPFMMYEGFLYAPIGENEDMSMAGSYEIDFGYTKKILMCSNFMFATQGGKKYYFSFPQRATVHLWIGDIKEMNRVEDE